MKKRLLGFLLGAMIISMCVGCDAENTTTEQAETATTTEDSTPAQTEEAILTPEETAEQAPESTVKPSEETTVETETETTTTEPMETATATTTEDSTPAQTEEAIATPEQAPESTVEPSEETTIENETETAESEPTETAVTTTTEDSTPAQTEESLTAPEETTEPAQTETPTTEPVPQYTYNDMSATMYAQQAVNVRDLPDTSGNKLGRLSTNDEITITGQCNETGWYRFEYNGQVAYVHNNYISSEMVVVQQQTPTDNTSTAETYDLGDGIPRQYGVLYVNTCGLLIGSEDISVDAAIPSQGPFPYPLYTLIDNGDGSYTAYEVHNHAGFIDGNFIHFSTERNAAFDELIYSQGYYVDSPDRYAWESCVGGYDEGCIHKIIVRKSEY